MASPKSWSSRIDNQRFVAVDMLVVRDGRQQHIFVQMVRGADVDNVDLGVFGDLPVIGDRHVRLHPGASLPGGFHPGGANVGDTGPERCLRIIQRQGQMRIGVHLSDKSETQNADSVCFHVKIR